MNYSTDLAEVHYVRQGDPRGLGHAVLRARMHVGNEPFAVLLGDDIIDERDVLLTRMIEVQAKRNATVIALLEVDPEVAHMYGVATVEATEDEDVVKVTGLVEKPSQGTAASNLAVIGRYVLQPEVFDVLERTPPGKGDEIQLTDALLTLATENIAGGVYRRGLPRASLRHRRPPRLHQGHCAARGGAGGPRSGAPAVAEVVRVAPGVGRGSIHSHPQRGGDHHPPDPAA